MNYRRLMPLVFFLVLTVLTVRLLTTLAEPGADDGGYLDFRDTVHGPASALLDGVNPYNVGEYPASDADVGQQFPFYAPHHLLLVIPLAVVPLAAAGGVWWFVNVALLLVVSGFAVLRVRPEWGVAGVFGVATVTLISNPGRFNFLTGQATLPIVLGVYLAFTSSNRWLAGAGTALALIKPQFGIPVLLLLVVSGRWRTAVEGTGIAALLSLPVVVALVFIEDGLGNLVEAVTDNLDSYVSADRVSVHRIDLVATFGREAEVRVDSTGTVLVFLVVAGFGAWLVWRWGRLDAIAMSVIGLVVLLSVFHLPYDELILVWPLVALVGAGDELGTWRWWAVGAMGAAAFNPLTVSILGFRRGFDTVTSLLLVVALATVAVGISRQETEAPAPVGLGPSDGPR